MRDRKYDWALGPSDAAAKQYSEDCAMMDCLNTELSGYGRAEKRKDRDPKACPMCDGHGCIDCHGSGYFNRWVSQL
jgi:hypothetical protein